MSDEQIRIRRPAMLGETPDAPATPTDERPVCSKCLGSRIEFRYESSLEAVRQGNRIENKSAAVAVVCSQCNGAGIERPFL